MPESDFFTPILDEDKRTNILSTVSSPVWSGGTATLTVNCFVMNPTALPPFTHNYSVSYINCFTFIL